MRGIKPSEALWSKVNLVLLGENTGTVMITFISAMCQMLIAAGVVKNEEEARVHLAAMVLSPDTAEKAGSLLPRLKEEFKKLEDGKWLG